MLFLQAFFFVAYTIAIITCLKVNLTKFEFYTFVFIYSLIAATLIRIISWDNLNEPFLGGVDSITYDHYGNLITQKTLSLSSYFNKIREDGFGIDDLGMPAILYPVYGLFGPGKLSQNFLILLNAFAITGCAWRMDGILKYFQIQRKVRKFSLAVFAFLPFLSLTAGVGLKENFFLYIIMSGFYYMFRYKVTKDKKYFIYAFLLSLCTFFFRLATCAMMILSFFICLISNDKNGKYIMKLLGFGSLIGFFLLSFILLTLFGRNLEAFIAIAEYRTGQVSEGVGSIGQWIIGFLAIFFGPFANFSQLSEYAIVHSSGVLLKSVLGFPIIMGIIYYTKNFSYKFFPLLVYFILNSLMVVLVGVSLDMRYQIPFYPMVIPYAAKFIQDKSFSQTFYYYILLLFLLIWFYNLR